MDLMIEKYNRIYEKVKSISEEIQQCKETVLGLKNTMDHTTPARIEHLEEQIKKIDEYQLKIKAFRQLAEKHINSKNVLTIEAPPNYRVNLNRLLQWAMMIDPTEKNDPYAQKVYLVAKCDEFFLSKKKQEFTEKIQQLKVEMEEGNASEIENLNQRMKELQEELVRYAESEELAEFSRDAVLANQKYIFDEKKEEYLPMNDTPSFYSPGAFGLPLKFAEKERERLKEKMGIFYNNETGRVYLPVERISPQNEFLMTISCVPARKKVNELDAGLRNFLLSIIDRSPVGSRKVSILDAERQNTALLGSAKIMQDTFALETVPRTKDQMTATIEKLAASFSDLDEIIEDYDSVIEYNRNAIPEKQITRKLLILIGWPNAFEENDRSLLKRIVANYERYGISLILVDFQEEGKKKSYGLSEYMTEDEIHIEMGRTETTITFGTGDPYKFAWYLFKGNLSSRYAASVKQHTVRKESLGNEYIKRCDFLSEPAYVREYKKLELPFGIDSKEKVHSVSFENENFAAYLVGASRSGKSTLLHTLIAGLIHNYHPDNVELWLADFKQLEFEKYITYLPPHVKYVLLDESTELVYDLIDKLTEKMMERQHLFAKLGKERIDQIDPMKLKEPLPVIFVILDEFSMMSQSLADSSVYKLRLQNLLAKGAALGIKFLFSSQTFTTGIAGLTGTARAQIQQRIAMKGTKEEISETLELSSNLRTEQVRNWMDALPPHYALMKYRVSADTLPEVKRVLVMYFKEYAVRNQMIQRINQKMIPVDQYDPGNINTYVNKHPVLVDGKKYDIYSEEKFTDRVNQYLRSDSAMEDEVYASIGTPRLMEDMKLLTLSAETKENILLIARGAEQACCASIISSMIKSFLLQKKKVSIWAYSKNRLYRTYGSALWKNGEYEGVRIIEDNDGICDAIYELRQKIEKREPGDELIILIGMDRICGDFEFADGVSHSEYRESFEERQKQQEEELRKKGALAESEEELEKVKKAQEWAKIFISIKKQCKAEGLGKEEMDKKIMEARNEFFGVKAETGAAEKETKPVGTTKKEVKTEDKTEPNKKEHQPGAYNAKDDFIYLVRQGSRLGYHFMMVLNDLSDLKQTFTKIDLYRHRMAFQVTTEDSRELFQNRYASELPEHICQYSNMLERYSVRPYLHKGITWEGWFVNEEGKLISPFVEMKDEC